MKCVLEPEAGGLTKGLQPKVFMKIISITVLIVLLASLAHAQHTAVSAQVKDTNGSIYRSCTGSASFIGQNSIPGAGPYLLGGAPFQTIVPIFCDGNGNFLVSLADNNMVSPTPSQWNFTICTAIGAFPGSPICFNVLITITGISQNVTTQITAAATILPTGGGGSSITLQTNGVNNGSQALLNLIQGTNITITDNGVGGVTINSSGGGGGGNVTTTPAAGVSQDILQQDGTHACINIDNSVNVCASWNWTPQTPAGALTAATPATVTLSPCVQGWNSHIYTPFNGSMHLDTVGTPEEVVITGATDCSAGSQTVQFTPANNHANGYTIRSSTQGWQEAWNAARFNAPGGSAWNQGGVIRAQTGTNYTWTGPLVIGPGTATIINNGTVDFTNSIIRCNVGSVSCLQIGDISNAHPELVASLQVLNFRGEPFVVNGTTCMIEDNGEGTKFDGIYTRSPSTAGATFGYYLCGDDDQAMEAFHVSTLQGLTGLRCDATFCGAVIKGGNGSAPNATVMWIHDSELSIQCRGNGVLNVAGNTMRISNVVIQGFAQYGISSIPSPGPNVLDNVYFEAGSCNNPQFGAPVQAGLMVGANTVIHGGEGPTGTLQNFANTGATKYFYFVVFEDGSAHLSTPFLAGTALSNGAGSINVKFFQPTTATKATLLRVSTNTSTLFGTGNFLVGSASQLLSGLCVSQICTMTDTNAALGAYTVPSGNQTSSTRILYFPGMTFWPGDVINTRVGDTTNPSCCANQTVTMDYLSTGGSNAGLVSIYGNQYPQFLAHQCFGYVNYSPVWVSCLQSSGGGATTFNNTNTNGGFTAGLKGRLNMGSRNADVPQHEITITDFNWDKTMVTSLNRPAADAGDTWIGYDSFNGFSTGLAFGSGTSTSISEYIGNTGDNASWLRRLTSSNDTVKIPFLATPTANNVVPLTAQCGSGAAGSQACMQVKDQGGTVALQVNSDDSVNLGAGATKSITTTTASNTDVTGELVFSGGTTSTSYTFTGTYISHPECSIGPQFDYGAHRLWWSTISTTTLQLSSDAVQTGNVSYVCIGRN